MLNTCAELFARLLESEDLKFDKTIDKDGDSVISIAFNGKRTTIFFTGDDGAYLSLYTVFERVPEDKVADVIFACNQLNCQYKWVTFYVDKDNDIVLHDDAILTVENAAKEAFELLIRMVKISDDIKPTIMRAIYA